MSDAKSDLNMPERDDANSPEQVCRELGEPVVSILECATRLENLGQYSPAQKKYLESILMTARNMRSRLQETVEKLPDVQPGADGSPGEKTDGKKTDGEKTGDEPDMRIVCLCVDDVAMNLKMLRSQLKKLDMECVFASSGEEALELLKVNHFDILLTDLWMPGISGADLLRIVRENHICDDLPVIAITADVEHAQNFVMGDFSRVILKPVTRAKLRQAIVSLAGDY